MQSPNVESKTKRRAPVYAALVHYPIRNRDDETIATAVTNTDVHDLARSACTYGLHGLFIITPVAAQSELVQRILNHWQPGAAGAMRVPKRAQAMQLCRVSASYEDVCAWIGEQHKDTPRVLATAANPASSYLVSSYRDEYEQLSLSSKPRLILWGTGYGLAKRLLDSADALLPPIRPGGPYNHLSVRAAAAIILDRLFGDAVS